MNKIYLFTLIVGILTPICGCEKFLDTLPDNRTELDTPEKISAILTSAYPNKCPKLMMQYGSDNFMDLGKQHGTRFLIQQEAYLWQDMTAMGNDNTRFLWQTHYSAISNANQALEAGQSFLVIGTTCRSTDVQSLCTLHTFHYFL